MQSDAFTTIFGGDEKKEKETGVVEIKDFEFPVVNIFLCMNSVPVYCKFSLILYCDFKKLLKLQ